MLTLEQQWERRKRYLRVKTSPGMFSSERCAAFSANGQHYSLLADESFFQDELMEVYLIEPVEDQIIVQLPADTFTSGCRIRVPWEMLIEA